MSILSKPTKLHRTYHRFLNTLHAPTQLNVQKKLEGHLAEAVEHASQHLHPHANSREEPAILRIDRLGNIHAWNMTPVSRTLYCVKNWSVRYISWHILQSTSTSKTFSKDLLLHWELEEDKAVVANDKKYGSHCIGQLVMSPKIFETRSSQCLLQTLLIGACKYHRGRE